MKLLQSTLVLCILACGLAQADEAKDKCGCAKPKPTPPTQVAKPGPQRTAAAPACPAPEQKGCPAKPKA